MRIGMADRKKPWSFKKKLFRCLSPRHDLRAATSLYRNFFAAGFLRYVA